MCGMEIAAAVGELRLCRVVYSLARVAGERVCLRCSKTDNKRSTVSQMPLKMIAQTWQGTIISRSRDLSELKIEDEMCSGGAARRIDDVLWYLI
jgi:hypothetical protein